MTKTTKLRFSFPVYLILIVVSLLASCQNGSDSANNNDGSGSAYPAGYPAPTLENAGYPVPQALPTLSTDVEVEAVAPQPDKSTVTGLVNSQSSKMPLMNVPVSLAEVFREGESAAYVLDGAQSPLAYTDKNGRFAFNDILPGEFVVVIGSVEVNDYMILTEPSGEPKVWAATPGNILEIETQFVDLDAWR